MYAFLIQGISIVLVFVSNWWLVRHTFTIAYGVYVNIFNWVSILAVLVLGGRDDLVLAQLPKYIAAGQRSRVLRLVKAANGRLFLSALFIFGGFLLVIAGVPIPSPCDLRAYLVIAMPAGE